MSYRLGQELGTVMGNHRTACKLLKNRFGLASYHDLPNTQYEAAQQFLCMEIAAYTGHGLYE